MKLNDHAAAAFLESLGPTGPYSRVTTHTYVLLSAFGVVPQNLDASKEDREHFADVLRALADAIEAPNEPRF